MTLNFVGGSTLFSPILLQALKFLWGHVPKAFPTWQSTVSWPLPWDLSVGPNPRTEQDMQTLIGRGVETSTEH